VGATWLRPTLLVLILVGLVGGGLADASGAASPTLPKVEDESGTYCCVREFVALEPGEIVFSNDGQALFAGARWASSKRNYHPLTWKTWTRANATGAGYLWAGGFDSGVRLTLWRPKQIHGYLLFTRITVTYKSHEPPKAPPTFVMALAHGCDCDWNGYNVKDSW
jgi:hypothetical protein